MEEQNIFITFADNKQIFIYEQNNYGFVRCVV